MTELDTAGTGRAEATVEPEPSAEDLRENRVDESERAASFLRRGRLDPLSWWTVFVAIVGLLLLAAAAIDLTVDDAGSQIVILVVAGVALLVLPLVHDRLAAVSFGTTGFRFELSRDLAARGAGATAELVDRSGGLAAAAETYGRIHARGLGPEDATERAIRLRLQDDLVGEASASARLHKYDADEVRRLFHDGSPVVRVLVLGLMLGDPSLASVSVLRSAIGEARTGNEQLQGLVLANRLRHRLSQNARNALTETMRNDPAIWRGTDRKGEARVFVGKAIADAAIRWFSESAD